MFSVSDLVKEVILGQWANWQPSNFRPISVLSVVGKLAEKVVSLQLLDYLSAIHAMSPNQYAYRPGHSTEDAIVDVVSAISDNRDRGHVTVITSCDLSKAFDCVDRQVLLRKLEWYGVSSHWFIDYFSGRMQCVRGSLMEHVDFGVIQGSILGPIMFNVLTNDLYAHLSDQCKAVSYADDTVILHSAPPSDEGLTALKASVEGDLASLATWFKNNGLKVNPSKTEMSLFGTLPVTKKASNFSVNFGNVSLTPAGQIRFLGVLLDQNLTMEKHAAAVVRRCFGILVTLKKLSQTLPKATLKTLVQALVFPHLVYCLPAWAPPTIAIRQRIDRVISFAARVVSGKRKHDHISETRRQLGWLSFEQVVRERDCLLVHRLLNSEQAPATLKSLVQHRADVSERETRASGSAVLHTRRCRLEATRRSVPVRPIREWNELPAELRRVTGRRAFLSGVTAFLVSPP